MSIEIKKTAPIIDVFALDHGYGAMKTSTGITFPTDIIPAQDQVFGTSLNDMGRIIYSDEKNGQYFIGEFAKIQIEANPKLVPLQEKLNEMYFRTEQYKMTMLTAIAASFPELETLGIRTFVTGLPNAFWKQYHIELAERFEGEHRFTVTIGDKTREMKVAIKTAHVIPQPYGTLCFYGYDNRGDVSNEFVLEQKVGIIDFGFYTTDIQLTDKLIGIPQSSASLTNENETVSQSYLAIQKKVLQDTGKTIVLQTMRERIEQGKTVYYEDGRMKSYDLKPIIHEVFEKMAQKVIDRTIALWKNYDLEYIILTGGGSAIPELVEPFKHMYGENLLLASELNIDPVYANVYGYANFGHMMTN